MDITSITFDVNNTLIYPVIGRAEAFTSVARSKGCDITLAQTVPLIPKMNKLLASLTSSDPSFDADEQRIQAINMRKYKYLCELLNIDKSIWDDIAREVQKIFEYPFAWRVYPDTAQTLELLKLKGYKLAIISNFASNLENIIRCIGLGDFFEVIVVSAVVGEYKPHTQIFTRTANLLGQMPEQCCHVGDSVPCDVEGSLAAGFHAVLLDQENIVQETGVPKISTLSELLSLDFIR